MVGNRTRKHPLPSAKWILPSHWQHCFAFTRKARPDTSSLRGAGDHSRNEMFTGQREWAFTRSDDSEPKHFVGLGFLKT